VEVNSGGYLPSHAAKTDAKTSEYPIFKTVHIAKKYLKE